MTSSSDEPTSVDYLLAQLVSRAARERSAAVEGLVRLSRKSRDAPVDRIINALQARTSGSWGKESDKLVRIALFKGIREVAMARGRQLGYLVSRPPDYPVTEARELTFSVVEHVWTATTLHEGRVVLRESLDHATQGQTALFALCWTDAEVHNGGFHQYFTNGISILVEEALSGLRLLGAAAIESVLRRALQAYPYPDPASAPEDWLGRLNDVAGLLDSLDREYYCVAGDKLFELTAAYVRANQQQFFRD